MFIANCCYLGVDGHAGRDLTLAISAKGRRSRTSNFSQQYPPTLAPLTGCSINTSIRMCSPKTRRGRSVSRPFQSARTGYFDVDVAVTREFRLAERFTLQARGEAFNALNHPNFGAPNATLSSSTFGQIRNARDPRILQALMKLIF